MRIQRMIFITACILVIVLAFRFCEFKKSDSSSIEYNTNLIEKQIVNVGKLVVTEGHYSEVITYKDQQSYFMNLFSFQKKALLVVNADVTIAYDLRQMKYDIDQKSKTITILNIPREEVKISPDIKFYDIDQSTMNPFTGDDYNKISRQVKENLARKIDKSTLKSNAKNRLVSELSKILILTNSLGWTLRYDGKTVFDEKELSKEIKG